VSVVVTLVTTAHDPDVGIGDGVAVDVRVTVGVALFAGLIGLRSGLSQ
jgi:hypothetical protein